jgi:hypothetical protein
MTDDLVKRLWESDEASALTNQAARRIEEVEAKLAKAVEALEKIEAGLPAGSSLFDGKNPLWRDAYRDLQRVARATLAELKGETS